ncbi:DUF3332 family protein [Vibrio sonorensis]|uniref:DUF3332 family protein n=1 Tax=Vibrio sonorensis TaxID=1004316 RepID=UPI0008D8E1A6|nr:DUF3332 family protein [Vibrio sonorensis]
MKYKSITIAMITAMGITSLTGCMGQMATTGMVSKFNLEVVDNRYAREGMFILLSPAYGIAGAADLFIVNAIEFWTGTNPISGKSPAVVDTPTKNYIEVNDKLDSSLTEVPLASNSNYKKAEVHQTALNELEMRLTMNSGEVKSLKGVKNHGNVDFYLNDEFITSVANQDLVNYVKTTRA